MDQSTSHNTDKQIWTEVERDPYAPSIHVTEQGHIGINVEGHVIQMPVKQWHEAGKRRLSPFISEVIHDACRYLSGANLQRAQYDFHLLHIAHPEGRLIRAEVHKNTLPILIDSEIVGTDKVITHRDEVVERVMYSALKTLIVAGLCHLGQNAPNQE